MRITHIETIPVAVPIHPHLVIHSSQGRHDVSPFLIVKVHTDTDIIGIGEASCTPMWSGEDHFTASRCITELLGPALVGSDPRDITHLSQRMEALLPENYFTKSAIEMALWDVLGKAANLPLYMLFGGKLRDSVPIKFSISGCLPARAAAIAAWAVNKGFETVKVKVGIERQQDLDRVSAVREAVGPNIRIGVDANGGWQPMEAIEMINSMAQFGIFFAEQPIPAGSARLMAEVRRSVGVPIIADESVFNLQNAIELVKEDAVDVFSVYVGKGGGTSGARKMAAIAEGAGICCTVGSNLELGIGSAAMIHLAASTPGIDPDRFPCDIIGPFYYETELLKTPLDLSGGRAQIPEGPGLGIELDDDAVAECRTHSVP